METKTVAFGFSALGQEARLDIVRLLANCDGAGVGAGDIANRLARPSSTVSFHLTALAEAGLVTATRSGRHVSYALRQDGLRRLAATVIEACCPGRPDIALAIAELLPFTDGTERRMQPAFNVLFVCTRNSARSILAEAILEKVGQGRFRAYSAGTEPAAAPMPEVIERLAVLGHDTSNLRSKSWHEFTGSNAPRMDFVITLCDVPQGEVCPDLGDRPLTAAWPFPDPAKFTGSAVERTTLLNGLYGMVRRRLEAFVHLPFDTLDSMALKARLDELGDSSRAAV